MKRNLSRLLGTVALMLLCTCLLCSCSVTGILEMFAKKQAAQPKFFLNTEILSLMKEETYALAVTPAEPKSAPSFDVEWSTDNPNIVTVNEGVLYGVSQGTTSVRARLTVHAETPFVRELVCTVTVTVKDVPLTGLSSETEKMTLNAGDAETIVLTFAPADTTETEVIWESSATEIAMVSADGTVIGLKEGKATITATSAVHPEMSVSCALTVKKSTNTVQSISLNSSSKTMRPHSTTTLSATVSPSSYAGSVDWSSNNADVATVDASGRVTAISTGKAIITAKAGGRTATCVITVSDSGSGVITAKSVELSRKTIRVINGPGTFKLDAVVKPYNASEPGIWTTSDAGLATVSDSGLVTVKALKKGVTSAEVTIRYYVNTEAYDTCVITILSDTALATVVSCNVPSYELVPKEKVKAGITVIPEKSLDLWVWSSSDESVATVSQDGTITAVAPGVARITCTSADRETTTTFTTVKVVTPEVTVTPTADTEDTISSYDPVSVRLLFEDTTKVPAEATYRFSVKGDAAVLQNETMDAFDGTVTLVPKKSGSVTVSVTVEAEESLYVYKGGELTLTFELTVPEEIDPGESSLELAVNEEKTLTPSLLPSGVEGHFSFSLFTEDTDVVRVDGMTVIAVGEGSATVTVLCDQFAGLSEDVTVTVSGTQTEE